MDERDLTNRSIRLYMGAADTQLIILPENRVVIMNAITKFSCELFSNAKQYFSLQGASISATRIYMENDYISMDIHLIENDDVDIDKIIRSGRFYLTGELVCRDEEFDDVGKNPTYIRSVTLESIVFKSVAFSDERKYGIEKKTLLSL